MATQAATFTATNTAALRQGVAEFLTKLNTQGNPDTQPPTVTITTDTAGTITFAVAALHSNPAYSKVITATVA